MLTKEFIRHKIDWEGWPDALEWFSGDRSEDPDINRVLDKAMDAYLDLESAKRELLKLLRK